MSLPSCILMSTATVRVLEEGMVLTVEPGCYFNAFLLEPALENSDLKEFLIKDRILSCMRFGGVRLEVRDALLRPALLKPTCTFCWAPRRCLPFCSCRTQGALLSSNLTNCCCIASQLSG